MTATIQEDRNLIPPKWKEEPNKNFDFSPIKRKFIIIKFNNIDTTGRKINSWLKKQ